MTADAAEALSALRDWLDEMDIRSDSGLAEVDTDEVRARIDLALAGAAAPAEDVEPTVRSALCPYCGHWHDSEGRPLFGWDSVRGDGRFWRLPPGHMPGQYRIDAATGWEPRVGTCHQEVPR